jgi:small subunit ribosomal protein S4e
MLKLAKDTREVKRMILRKQLKINGKPVKDKKESIKIFNILEADKTYVLSVLPTGRFIFKEVKEKKERLCKVLGKKILSKGTVQLNLHDGSNILTAEKIGIGDSIYLSLDGKVSKTAKLEKGKAAFIMSGKYSGLEGEIESVSDKSVKIKFKDKESSTELNKNQVAAI